MTEIYDDDDRRLDAAVALGIISAEQAAGIRALTPRREAPRSARAVGAPFIAYVLGAVTVLIAMAWFLADRWDYLGAGGVLAVTVVYGVLFTLVALRMRREGVAVAEGIAALLTVALVPLVVIALSELLPWLPQAPSRACGTRHYSLLFWFDFWTCRGLEITVELATLGAAAVAWRLTRFSPFALVVGALAMRFVFHAAAWASGGHAAMTSAAWLWVICASIAAAVAYAVDRRPSPAQDVGPWLHLLAAFAAMFASALLLDHHERFRHLLLPTAFVAFAFSLRMRRGIWTLLGLGWFVTYLGWLAAEVFRDTPVFPIILAALGIGVIVATVWVQRNRERLVARFGGLESGAAPRFPGGVGLLLLPVLVAALQLPAALAVDRAEVVETRARLEAERRVRQRQRRQEMADSLAQRRVGDSPSPETVSPPRP